MFDVVITPAGVREDLVACCEDAAEWRLHRAAELWQNRRHMAAVDALEAAAESIAELPDDDPQLGRLAWVYERLSDDQRVLAFSEQRRAVRSHGYDGAVAPSALLVQVTRGAEAILEGQSQSGGGSRAVSRRQIVAAAPGPRQGDKGGAGARGTTVPLAPTGTNRAAR
jgi:hypothetical protein